MSHFRGVVQYLRSKYYGRPTLPKCHELTWWLLLLTLKITDMMKSQRKLITQKADAVVVETVNILKEEEGKLRDKLPETVLPRGIDEVLFLKLSQRMQ